MCIIKMGLRSPERLIKIVKVNKIPIDLLFLIRQKKKI